MLSFAQLVLTAYRLQVQAQALRERLATLQAEHQHLQAELRYWQSDEALEKLARERLGWVKPGETLVLVPAPRPTPTAVAAPHR
jgi:cell division protein FtsB